MTASVLDDLDGASALFVRIPKTASSSMERVLNRIPGVILNSTTGLLSRENWPDNWIEAGLSNMWIEKFGQEGYRRLFSFAFVRNPYERACSSWLHVRRIALKGNPVCRPGDPAGLLSPHLPESFDVFLDMLQEDRLVGEAKWHSCLQSVHISDDTGRLNVDYVGRFENLQRDFNHVMDELGHPQVKLDELRQSGIAIARYSEFFNARRRRTVTRVYLQDLELLGYPTIQ